jgi:hypothetical protein
MARLLSAEHPENPGGWFPPTEQESHSPKCCHGAEQPADGLFPSVPIADTVCPIPPPPHRGPGGGGHPTGPPNTASLLIPSGRTRTRVRGRPWRHGCPQPPSGKEGRTCSQLPHRGTQEPQRQRMKVAVSPGRGGLLHQASFPARLDLPSCLQGLSAPIY